MFIEENAPGLLAFSQKFSTYLKPLSHFFQEIAWHSHMTPSKEDVVTLQEQTDKV